MGDDDTGRVPNTSGTTGPASARAPSRALLWLPGLAVALGAAIATAHGLFEVAVAARVPTGIAWLYPLICECRCGAPGWGCSRLGAGSSVWLPVDLAAAACLLSVTRPPRLPAPAWPTSWPDQKLVRPQGRGPSQMCRSVIPPRPVPTWTRTRWRGDRPLPMLADVVDAVVGVDTHRDTHQAEIASSTGAPVAACSITNDSTGFAELLAWIIEHAPGPRVVLSIEGTRGYGLGLSRAVVAAGMVVIEAGPPGRKSRRGHGKSDPIDAHLAVLAALRLDADKLPAPRADGDREALRILLTARGDLTTTYTAQMCRLRALLLGGDDTDRDLARGRLGDRALSALARRRCPRDADRAQAVRQAELRRLAVAVRDGARLLRANRSEIKAIVDDLAPGLTDRRGVGPVTAAQAIVSYSHPGRCRNEAAFAALAGTSPLEASSGRTTRHRLNPGGDRALNAAMHTVALTRMRCCERTRAYVARRTAEGKSTREIRRCLKRYIAREFYRALTPHTAG